MDTIFALATAQGKAGVAVVRVSGPAAWNIGEALCGTLPASHTSGLRALRDRDGTLIDQALVLPFAKGRSFTGEQVVEFHLHGSIAIIARVLSLLGAQQDARLAEPGEFTRRALENGCLDLAQVEGLADLIDAETEAQRKQAVRILAGDLGAIVSVWRTDLIRAAALLEATIDFADEDVPVDVSLEVRALLEKTQSAISKEARGAQAAERIRTGFEVAIIGAPNVGKSTLLNALAGREAAITSEFAGTTRDVIEVRMDLGGLPVTLLDTAGLRETQDAIEQIGIARAVERAAGADLRVFLSLDGAFPSEVEREPSDLLVQAKADVNSASDGLAVSGLTGSGVDALVSQITDALKAKSTGAGLATRERHARAMQRAIQDMDQAKLLLDDGPDIYDLAAEELRSAIRALNSLIGHVDVENLLDEIFASFCLGK